jgi:2-polyprenyl-3-methyl-5-hydroxy-6-metoxy-1,4-benzoquinol methylase
MTVLYTEISMTNADKDLTSQQHHLSSTSYDLRITNLARFIYRLIQDCHPELVSGSLKMPKQVRHDTPTFLDVGAGNGLFLKFFKQKGFTVSGIELEKELVENIKKDPELKGINISQGDITKIAHPRGGKQYHVVLASDVIEHIKDDTKAIKGLWSHVAPGGLMIITVPAHSHLYGKRDKMWGHYRRYDSKLLVDRIKESLCHPELVSGSQKMPKQVRHDKQYKIEFITHWNIVGYFIYFLYEKILHKSINENMRYSDSIISKFIRFILDSILKIEELIGGLPWGLTLVAVVRKNK